MKITKTDVKNRKTKNKMLKNVNFHQSFFLLMILLVLIRMPSTLLIINPGIT